MGLRFRIFFVDFLDISGVIFPNSKKTGRVYPFVPFSHGELTGGAQGKRIKKIVKTSKASFKKACQYPVGI